MQPRHAPTVIYKPPPLAAEAGARRRQRDPLIDLTSTAILRVLR